MVFPKICTVFVVNCWQNFDVFWQLEVYNTGPKSRATHWKQTVLYLEDVLTICEGEAISGSLTVAPNKKNPRDVDIMLKYSLQGRHSAISRIQYYKMRWVWPLSAITCVPPPRQKKQPPSLPPFFSHSNGYSSHCSSIWKNELVLLSVTLSLVRIYSF